MFAPGAYVNFGGLGTLSNNGGIMSPGAGLFIGTTTLSGSLYQSAGSDYLVDLDLQNNRVDRFVVSGTASLAGTVDLQLYNMGAAAPGTYAKTIVTAGGGITDHSGLTLALPKSAVASFSLAYPDANDLQLGYTIDFAPRAKGALGANDVAFGEYVNRIQNAGSTTTLQPLAAGAFAQPSLGALQRYYAQATPSGTLAASPAALQTNLDFSGAMLGCRNGDRLASNESCSWGALGSQHAEQKGAYGSVGYAQSMSGVSSGFQRAIRDGRTLVGAALRYDTGALDAIAGQQLKGDAINVGVLAKRLIGRDGSVSASIVAGSANYASTRTPPVGGVHATAHGNQHTSYVGAHLRAERAIERGATTLTPFVDVGATRVNAGALDETGAGALDVRVGAHSETFATMQTGVSLATVRHAGSTTLRPALELSVTELVGNARSATSAALDGAPTGVAPFVLTNTLDRTRFNLGPSLSISQKNKLDVKVGGAYQFSGASHNLAGYVQIGKKI